MEYKTDNESKSGLEIKPVTVELATGYTDREKITHKKVIIEKQVNGFEFFLIDMFWEYQSDALLTALMLSRSVAEFGALKTNFPFDIFLNLDTIDFENLAKAFNEFTTQNGIPEAISPEKLKLVYGYKKDGITFDIVEFGKLSTGNDEVEADRLNYKDNRRNLFIAGRKVVRLSQNNGDEVLEHSLTMDDFGSFDLIDLMGIMEHSRIYTACVGYLKKQAASQN